MQKDTAGVHDIHHAETGERPESNIELKRASEQNSTPRVLSKLYYQTKALFLRLRPKKRKLY